MNWEQEYLQRATQQPLFDDLPPLPTHETKQQGQLRWFSDPRSDNQKLMSWQYEYKTNGSQEALGEIYKLCRTIAAKFINTIAKKNRKVKELSAFDKEAKATDAATYIVQQMITRPDFAITKSWTGYLYLRVEFELYYRRKVDKMVDFVDLDRFFKEGTEPEEEDKLLEYWEGQQEMKSYVAIGEDGENKEFKSQSELKAHFAIGTEKFYEALETGKPLAEPGTLKIFYIDELD